MTNILLLKPGAIGDLLQITPVIRALVRKFPDARITVLVGNEPSVDLFRHNPYIAEVIVFEKKGRHRSWRAMAGLRREIGGRRFDLVVNFQRSNLKAWWIVSSCFPCRVLVYRKAKGRIVHAVVNHLEAVAPLGIDPVGADPTLEMHVGQEDDRWADELIAKENPSERPLVALNVGASHPVNRWPIGQFAELARRLYAEAGATVLLVGGAGDRVLSDAVRDEAKVPLIDLVGKTSLLQLGALLKKCAVVVSGDTGPMHMATAVGTPVVALFGAADPERTGPVGEGHKVLQARGVDCVPCRSRRCGHTPELECMTALSVSQVLDAMPFSPTPTTRC